MLEHLLARYIRLCEESWYKDERRDKSAIPFRLTTSDPEAHSSVNAVQQTIDALWTLWAATKKEGELMASTTGSTDWEMA